MGGAHQTATARSTGPVQLIVSLPVSAAVNRTSYWIGLGSDEEGETALTYADWQPFDESAYSRFSGTPSMAAPACTLVTDEDGFASWRESACDVRAHVLCQYQGTYIQSRDNHAAHSAD